MRIMGLFYTFTDAQIQAYKREQGKLPWSNYLR